MAAFTAGDVATCLEILGSEIELLPAGEPALSGKNACGAWLADQHARFHAELRISRPAVRMGTDRALERSASVRVLRPVDAAIPLRRSGTLVALWLRSGDGVWRLSRYVESPWF